MDLKDLKDLKEAKDWLEEYPIEQEHQYDTFDWAEILCAFVEFKVRRGDLSRKSLS